MKKLELAGLEYGKNTDYAGCLNGFHYILKIDTSSNMFTLYWNIKNSTKDSKLIEDLKDYNKEITLYLNNNKLVINGLQEEIKINSLIEKVTKLLKKNQYQEVCKHCKKEVATSLVSVNGDLFYMCEDCYKEKERIAHEKNQKKENIKDKPLEGICGAILGAIPGMLIWILLSYINATPILAGFIIALGTSFGYKKLARAMKLKGILIVLCITFIAILTAHELNCSLYIFNLYKDKYEISLIDAYQSIPYYLKTIEDFHKSFYSELNGGYALSLLGLMSTYSFYRQNKNLEEVKKMGESK